MNKPRCSHEEVKEALALHRQSLKAQLWKRRKDECMTWPYYTVRPGAARPMCDYCGALIQRPDECAMHEWLLKRNRIPLGQQIKVMHEYNCVLTHILCHARYGQTREFTIRCADAQYRRYGRDAIVRWVHSLGLKQHVEIPPEDDGPYPIVDDAGGYPDPPEAW